MYRTWAQTPIVRFWITLLRNHSSNLTVRHLKWFGLMREGSLQAACFYHALTLPSKANPADPEAMGHVSNADVLVQVIEEQRQPESK